MLGFLMNTFFPDTPDQKRRKRAAKDQRAYETHAEQADFHHNEAEYHKTLAEMYERRLDPHAVEITAPGMDIRELLNETFTTPVYTRTTR